MSKTGNFVIDIQADAVELGRDEFVNNYGENNAYVWDQVRFQPEPDPEPYYYPGSDPQE